MRHKMAAWPQLVGIVAAAALVGCASVAEKASQPIAVASTPCFGPSPAADAAIASKHGITVAEVAVLRERRQYDDDRFCRVPTVRVKRHLANLNTTVLQRAEAHPAREYLLNIQRNDDGTITPRGYADALDARAKLVAAERAKLGGLARNNWIALGPYDIAGRIKAILIDPDNPQQMWIGAASGGLWRSTDAGANWLPIDDFFASPFIQALAMDSQNRNIMYAGTGEGAKAFAGTGILKSTDRGRTWRVLAATSGYQFIYRIATHPTQSNVLVAAVTEGVIRSVDGGETWTLSNLDPDGIGLATVDVAYDPNNPQNLVAGNTGGVVAISSDGGATWRRRDVMNPVPTEAPFPGRVELEYAKSAPGVVYASVDQADGQIYRSTNGGDTWTLMSTPKHVQTQGSYGNTLWVDPTNANVVVAAGIDVYRSTDGGANFTRISDWAKWPNSAHADHHYLIHHPGYNGTTNKQVWLGTDGGLYRVDDITAVSIDAGWVPMNNNLQITQFYHGAGRRDLVGGAIFGGTQDNGTPAALGSAPRNWAVVVSGDGGFAAPDPTSPNRFFGTLQNGGLFRQNTNNPTLNRGNEYICAQITEVYPQFCTRTNVQRTLFITPIEIDLRTPTRLYLGADSLWASDNANAADAFDVAWRAIKPPITANGQSAGSFIAAIAPAPSDSNVLYVGHARGQLFRSANAMSAAPTFTQLPLPGSRQIRQVLVDRTDPQKVFVTFGGFTNNNLQVSSDGGQTWRSITGNLPAAPIHSVAVNPSDSRKLYVGTEVGVFASEDEGATWSATNEGPGTVPVYRLFFYDNTNLVAVTFGRGMWQIDVSGTDPNADSDGDGMSNRVEALEGRNPTVRDNDIFANSRLFVQQMYRDFLTREGDAGGVNFWVGRINGGERTRAQMAEEYVNSAEFQGRVAPIVRISFAINRAIPDFTLTFQRVAQRDAGRTIEQIGQDVYTASPLAATYNGQAEAAFVAALYNDMLGRAPSAAESAAAATAIASVGRGGLFARVANTDEYARRSYNQVYVTMMYMGMLRRAPEQGGFDFWVGVMNGGQSGLGLVQAFLDAPEYRGRFLPPR